MSQGEGHVYAKKFCQQTIKWVAGREMKENGREGKEGTRRKRRQRKQGKGEERDKGRMEEREVGIRVKWRNRK